MDEAKILKQLDRIDGQPVVVIGDVILDHYQWGEVSRISPEAPVPVVYVENETYSLGGAANVARNIRAMGAEPFLVGVAGRDKYGEHIQTLLKKEGISGSLHFSAQRKTTIKTRVMGNSQQIVRVDMETLSPLSPAESKGLQKVFAAAPSSQYVIVSDYGKGVITDASLNMVKEKNVIVDPKTKNFNRYEDVFIMTPNKLEAQEGSGVIIETRQDVIRAGKTIMDRNKAVNLLVTMGPEGMILFKENNEILHITTSARKVFDVTGAGDTVIGVLGAGLEAGLDIESACVLANFAAGIVVGQVGTAAADRQEIKSVISRMKIPAIKRWE